MKFWLAVLFAWMILVGIFSTPADARFGGSQTFELEYIEGRGLATISISMLEYKLSNNESITLVVDSHPVHGRKANLSFTRFFNPLGKMLYVTAGVSKGFWDNKQPFRPYVSATYRF